MNIAPGLDFTDLQGKTLAILAQRGAGKTHTAKVIAEEFVKVGQPWVAIDPTGAWWGLREKFPVVILGGEHGDIPLDRGDGRGVADLVTDEPGWYVLDFSLFGSKAADQEFGLGFAERLFRSKAHAKFPLHIFIDEADIFAPQSARGDKDVNSRLLGAYETLVRRGRSRGIAATLISQRSAALNKNVLEMLDLLIALRTTGVNDRKRIKEYVEATGSPEQVKELTATLPALKRGEAWVWEPGEAIFGRFMVRALESFDSSSTPTGAQPVEPKRFAAIDLDAVKERMAASIERAQRDDPVLLRKQIAELKREVAKKPKAEMERVVETVEVQRLPDGLESAIRVAVTAHVARLGLVDGLMEEIGAVLGEDFPEPARRVVPEPPRRPATAPLTERLRERPPPSDGTEDPGKSPRRILSALALHGALPKDRLALIIGMTASGGSFNRYLSTLRSMGYAEGSSTIAITSAGIGWADVPSLPLPRPGAELLDWWVDHRSVGKSRGRILRALADGGGSMDKEALAEAIGMEWTGGSFNRYLSTLRSLGLIDGSRTITLADDLR